MKHFEIILHMQSRNSSSILPTGNMKTFYYFGALFFGFLTIIHAAEPLKSNCLEKVKAITTIETAEDLLTKAKKNFPSCKEDANSKNASDCAGQKSLAYIEISQKLISDVRNNFPSCSESSEKVASTVQHQKYRSCFEILASGRNVSGVYTIWVGEPLTTAKPMQVYCDLDTAAGGWTVIQRRGKFPVQLDFNKDWKSYMNGFGSVTEEFWLGNENIRILCLKGCEIRFDLQAEDGEQGFALYQSFNLSSSNYRLNISGYRGNIGDGMQYHNNYDFSTKDKGDTASANKYKGGWWLGSGGYYCNLNGIFQPGKNNQETVSWFTWRKNSNLARVEMKVRPN